MGLIERKQREKEEVRQAILNAAGEMFAQNGYDNVTIRKIAERIEYSPTTIYSYFKDKTDLANCLLQNTFNKLTEEQNKILEQEGSSNPVETLKKFMYCYIKFGINYPYHYQLLFMTPEFATAHLNNIYQNGSIDQIAYNNLRSLINICLEKKVFKPIDPDIATQIIWATNHGITSLFIAMTNFPWAEQEKLIQQSIDVSINGLK